MRSTFTGFEDLQSPIQSAGTIVNGDQESDSIRNKIVASDSNLDREKETAPFMHGNKINIKEALYHFFGHNSFRDGQKQVIKQLLDGRSTAAILPTGAGKSLCYQLPGLILAQNNMGITVIVSPLIALMKDQVDSLKERGLPCHRLDSSLDVIETRMVYDKIRQSKVGLLYISPERFNNERFLRALEHANVSLFIVDEAHCISEWGHNFRPDYLRLAEFARLTEAKATLALTATATPQVISDICTRLNIEPDKVVQTPVHRSNLTLLARKASDILEERVDELASRILSRSPGSIIVYTMLRQTTERTAELLSKAGINARSYHAGLSNEDRSEVQDWFMRVDEPSESKVVVGTIAFGMGLDKKNVRYVYHLSLPRSLESYSQEVGRAGRDGEPSLCEVLVTPSDLPVMRAMIHSNMPGPSAVRGLLYHVFEHDVMDGLADVSIYDLSQLLDAREEVLRTLLAHLQISGKLREGTSYYETQQVALVGFEDMLNVLEEKVNALNSVQQSIFSIVKEGFSGKSKRIKWLNLNVKEMADRIGTDVLQIPRLLQELSDSGLIIKGASKKIRSRFHILTPPESPIELESLSEKLYEKSLQFEKRELDRLNQVLHLLCNNGGNSISKGLSEHFADPSDSIAAASQVDSSTALTYGSDLGLASILDIPALTSEEIDKIWNETLDLLPVELQVEDPLVVTRFVMGIKTPRISKLKVVDKPGFGACASCSFDEILSRAKIYDSSKKDKILET